MAPSSQRSGSGPANNERTSGPRETVRKKRLFFVGVSSALIIVAAGACAAWIGFKAATISDELNAANRSISELKKTVLRDDPDAAAATVAVLQEHTSKARKSATDPLWTVAGAIPWFGANFQATSEVATSADDIARLGAAPLVSVIRTLDWRTLVPHKQELNLSPLADAQPKIVSAAQAVRQSSDRLNAIDADALMPEISEPLIHARNELNSFRDGLDSAADAATLIPDMLGATSPRRYLLLIQNNSEARSTGGIPGALAVLTVDNGKIALGSQTSASAMGPFNPVMNVDPEQRAIYSARLGKFMQDVNLTPDFPTAADTALAMWKTTTGQQLDGVLSIDPIALSYMLEATGPVKLTDPALHQLAGNSLPTELTAKNVVPTLLSDVYARISEPDLQDVYFAGVAQEVFSKLSSGGGDTKKLIDGVTRGASERRILLSSSKADEEAMISQYPLGGAITGTSIAPSQFGVYFNDGTGAKMDYHVKRSVQLIEECPANGYAQVKVRVTSTNTAPAHAATSLPPYVTGGGAFGVPPGTVQTNVVAYGPVQANVETAVADGKKISFASHTHSGRPVGTVTVALPPGKTSTIDFTFGKIVQHTERKLSVTPTVQASKDVVLDTIFETCPAVP